MSDIKEQLIRLGAQRRDLRKHIRPLIAEIEKRAASFSVNAEITYPDRSTLRNLADIKYDMPNRDDAVELLKEDIRGAIYSGLKWDISETGNVSKPRDKRNSFVVSFTIEMRGVSDDWFESGTDPEEKALYTAERRLLAIIKSQVADMVGRRAAHDMEVVDLSLN